VFFHALDVGIHELCTGKGCLNGIAHCLVGRCHGRGGLALKLCSRGGLVVLVHTGHTFFGTARTDRDLDRPIDNVIRNWHTRDHHPPLVSLGPFILLERVNRFIRAAATMRPLFTHCTVLPIHPSTDFESSHTLGQNNNEHLWNKNHSNNTSFGRTRVAKESGSQ
jgi:hypothetical protein